ncbi:MAG: diguanylate cyclase [Clostridia bacterium]|nr:diguanylate cyclase [Clostridia bacterium]
MLNNKKNTILIIDSDHVLTKKLSDRLNSVGFGVLSATNADMAYKLFLVSKPDIILIDIHMKDSSGNDIFLKIKTKAVSDKIPIIILSSDVDVNTKVYSFLSGASDYIVKPFSFAEVLARINTQLKIVSIQRELEQKNRELTESNALLQKLAITDALTGLYNKRYILSKLHTDIAHSIRYKEPISFIIADIDHFKRINDRYGHQVGDLILKDAASIIRKSVREVDIVARYGGEEFLIICPNTERHGAVLVAERVRKGIASHNFFYSGKEIHITISFGVKCSVFNAPTDTEKAMNKLIEEADKALFRAKTNGRNRIEVFEEKKEKKSEQSPPLDAMHKSNRGDDKFLN